MSPGNDGNSFNVCRMCRRPGSATKLTSLFGGFGEKAEIFMLVAGTDVRIFSKLKLLKS